MAVLVLNVDTGLFILSFFWILALIICLKTKITSLRPLYIIDAIVVSIILIFILGENVFSSAEEQSVIYGYIGFYRYGLIALFVVIGLVLFLLNHTMKPVRAQPLCPKTANGKVGECVVCFEETFMVQIHPCRHSTLCKKCVLEIIVKGNCACPMCRCQIQDYSEVF